MTSTIPGPENTPKFPFDWSLLCEVPNLSGLFLSSVSNFAEDLNSDDDSWNRITAFVRHRAYSHHRHMYISAVEIVFQVPLISHLAFVEYRGLGIRTTSLVFMQLTLTEFTDASLKRQYDEWSPGHEKEKSKANSLPLNILF